MNWDAIGALGELIGALVVLITLIYLAVQIRQNAQATRAATEMQATEMLRSWAEARASDPNYQRIWNELAEGREISDNDKIQFVWTFSPLCVVAQGVLDQYEAGLVSEICWNNFERTLVGLLKIADFVTLWWEARDGSFSPSLYERIDSVLRESPHEWKPRSSSTWSMVDEGSADDR